MKILDEKGKLFGLINIIDLGVILVILAVIAGGIWYMKKDTPAQTVNTKDYYITLKVEAVSKDVLDALEVGDRFYYGNSFLDVTITEIDSEPARIDVYTADGDIIVKRHPELLDIYVKVLVKSPANEPMIYIAQTHATVGKLIALKTDRVEVPSVVIRIE
ncbi:MAG: DUF4330 domain-containing protein [Clostridiaceae bacterium]|jgi:hypothetical protein|nr:DUF4330 domain-containing protein [Clostridiaceae bacterium]